MPRLDNEEAFEQVLWAAPVAVAKKTKYDNATQTTINILKTETVVEKLGLFTEM